MGVLSDDLQEMGFQPTGRESPIDESGELWSNGYEVICDETGIIINDDRTAPRGERSERRERVFRYRNSERVKLPGGYIGSYSWGTDNDGLFQY